MKFNFRNTEFRQFLILNEDMNLALFLQLPKKAFLDIKNYMLYNFPLQIHNIEGALLYKTAPLKPPSIFLTFQPPETFSYDTIDGPYCIVVKFIYSEKATKSSPYF